MVILCMLIIHPDINMFLYLQTNIADIQGDINVLFFRI